MALILTRTEDQEIVTDGPVTIRVVRIRGNRVTIACESERKTRILRGEVERKEPANKHA
jgi:sRNA-binding carbon storage regulator CsrA